MTAEQTAVAACIKFIRSLKLRREQDLARHIARDIRAGVRGPEVDVRPIGYGVGVKRAREIRREVAARLGVG